jgi:superfamily II DNA/RNA helicase
MILCFAILAVDAHVLMILCFAIQVHGAGFLNPTRIQAQTWPHALQNQVIVAIAKTGGNTSD